MANCPNHLIFFLRPIDAMSIMQVLTIYEQEIDKALNEDQGTLMDHTSKQAVLDYRRQLAKQFGDEELKDVKQDLAIMELMNQPDKNDNDDRS